MANKKDPSIEEAKGVPDGSAEVGASASRVTYNVLTTRVSRDLAEKDLHLYLSRGRSVDLRIGYRDRKVNGEMKKTRVFRVVEYIKEEQTPAGE